ncbi:hypothetical protein [Aquimarina rubra]|uniref:Uncharacterized protein n=1 Tax=Aquimarina rubra TaxID=1920033 RepID=A0ABW5L9Q7_9FLAO
MRDSPIFFEDLFPDPKVEVRSFEKKSLIINNLKIFKMKKILFLALTVMFVVGCSSDNEAEIQNTNQIDFEKYSYLFEDYQSFRVDGQVMTDKQKIIEGLLNAQATHYNTVDSEVDFYTSEEVYQKLTNQNFNKFAKQYLTDNLENSTYKTGSFNEYGELVEDKDSNTETASKSSLHGISGLGSVAGDSDLKAMAHRVFFIFAYNTSNNKDVYFQRAQNNSNLSNNPHHAVKVDGKSAYVSSPWVSSSFPFYKMYSGNNTIQVKNDKNGNSTVYFCEYPNYGGKRVSMWVGKDQIKTISRYTFSNFSQDRPQSLIVQ